jgi:glycine cleavage system H lipoate-binding protein
MTTVRIGAGTVKNVSEVLDWLDTNIGKSNRRNTTGIVGTEYIGQGWSAIWKPYGAGWFMDVKFNDPKHAAFFTLRWK